MPRKLRILLIGSGGREHAFAHKLAQSEEVEAISCLPGNPGMAAVRLRSNGNPVTCYPLGVTELAKIVQFAVDQRIDLVVIGPEGPLIAGLADALALRGIKVVGASRRAARFESSKAYTQRFCIENGVSIAPGEAIYTFNQGTRYIDEHGTDGLVVKVSEPALGKGALICPTAEEARQALKAIMVDGKFGKAGDEVVIQRLLKGPEASLHYLCDGKTVLPWTLAQDYKRVGTGNTGLNCGGAGSVSAPWKFEPELLAKADHRIIRPWQAGCDGESIEYRGFLFPGVIIPNGNPNLLEFNSRFGDPETQSSLLRLLNDLAEVLWALASDELSKVKLRWSDEAVVCTVLMSKGYPETPKIGYIVAGLKEASQVEGVDIIHAGTKGDLNDLRSITTSGGRVLGIRSTGSTVAQARNRVYEAVDMIKFEGMHFRTDIGEKEFTLG